MTEINPEKRIDIKEAIDEINKFGDDSFKKQAVFGNYVNIVKEKLVNDKQSINVDQDIE